MKWISVIDSLPISSSVVVCLSSDPLPFVCIFQGNDFLSDFVDEKGLSRAVSYWMPLPEPPQEGANPVDFCDKCQKIHPICEICHVKHSICENP
jgi:hypothetical protein